MTIAEGTQACWTAVGPAGRHDELAEFVGHFPTRALAEADMDHGSYAGKAVGVAQMTAPCWVAVSECGTVYDEDGEGAEDFADGAQARAALTGAGFTVLPDGTVYCPGWVDCSCPLREVGQAAA